ncbi:hypothetical protein AJ78_06371 [Emergomyces pasteurianus Ep9510]|uniref:Uncharacterized protein n=1 Tax=Emergomyces pasteurianus Ep9510 TaxID=1447872 RepID=A0A1J9QB54_9EURO|nr:hypothetical protein AJ78_06371 [Emergomyces pasteurianus Ep9510]
MFCHHKQLENWAIPAGIPRNTTYKCAASLCLDLLTEHDNRLRHQGNAAYSSEDTCFQAAHLVLMRTLLQKFTGGSLRDGPFAMQLTDMHASSSLHVDQIEGPAYERFKLCYEKFTNIFKQEDMETPLCHNPTLYSGATTVGRTIYSPATTINIALEDGRYWYFSALILPKALYNLFEVHILPIYDQPPPEAVVLAISAFWTPGMSSFVDSKMKEFVEYLQEVRDIFNSKKSGRPYYDV